MTQGEILRKKIFDKYSANLKLLSANGMLPGVILPFENTYICPSCMRPFSEDHLDTKIANHLTLEDIPPKSLGGKPAILTCRECNNTAGQKIDSQLYSRMMEMDKRKFVPGSSFHAKFKQDGKVVQGEVNVEGDGTIKIKHSYKRNQKDRLEGFMKDISPSNGNPLMNIEFYESRIDFKRLQVGLLKTAYLLYFEKYGYLFINDPIYDIVREQIANPDQDIYPSQFWLIGPFKESDKGVHFVTNEGLECIMVIFSLQSLTTRTFGAILPVKTKAPIEVIAGFHASIALNVEYEGEFHKFDEPRGYLSDLANAEQVKAFNDVLKNRQ